MANRSRIVENPWSPVDKIGRRPVEDFFLLEMKPLRGAGYARAPLLAKQAALRLFEVVL